MFHFWKKWIIQGIGKKFSQTPSQYYDQLISIIPQQEEALRILTNGFEEARYSGRTIYENEANHLHKVWKSLINPN